MDQLRILMKCSYDDTQERWVCPELDLPEELVTRKQPFAPTPWVKELFRQLSRSDGEK